MLIPACAEEIPMATPVEDKTKQSTHRQVRPRLEEAVVEGRHVWVERDATDSIIGVCEVRQVLEDTDEDYAVIVRHREKPHW
jgi:hypothetical protein